MRPQIKISPGVYVTDFRKNGQLKGIDTEKKAQTKDAGLLLDKISNNQSKINQLLFTIDAIKEEQNWETDNDFLQAIQQDYQLMFKFTSQMKEWILDLNSLKYKPENDKIQKLIDAKRITDRQNQIQTQFNNFLQQYGRYLQKADAQGQQQNKAAEVSSDSENDDKNKITVNKISQVKVDQVNEAKDKTNEVQKDKSKKQEELKKPEQEEGIYL